MFVLVAFILGLGKSAQLQSLVIQPENGSSSEPRIAAHLAGDSSRCSICFFIRVIRDIRGCNCRI